MTTVYVNIIDFMDLKLYVHSQFSAITVSPTPCKGLALSRMEGIT
jgi:hypothetical protein